MSSKLSRRHYLAVIHGNFRVLMRYALYGNPSAPRPLSLVGMSQSHRKRKARELAFFRVKQAVLKSHSMQAEVLAARERGEAVDDPWDKNRLTHPEAYLTARGEFRIGERLRPCRFCAGPELFNRCKGKQIAVDVVGDHRRGECVFCRTCVDAALTLRFENPDACDGSGLIVTRIRCPGDHHFLIAERRWIPSSTCRLCTGRGVVKYPLDRTGPKCPGCCNCAVGVCKKLDPDGFCGEEYMHCTDGILTKEGSTL